MLVNHFTVHSKTNSLDTKDNNGYAIGSLLYEENCKNVFSCSNYVYSFIIIIFIFIVTIKYYSFSIFNTDTLKRSRAGFGSRASLASKRTLDDDEEMLISVNDDGGSMYNSPYNTATRAKKF